MLTLCVSACWCSWCCRSSGHTDFPLDQLDVKKKIKPKIPAVVARLSFLEKGSAGAAVGSGQGYEMVAVTDPAGIELGGVVAERGSI